jgi:NAD-dependent dihydropyrimidine dehydrogenase PreA subunit
MDLKQLVTWKDGHLVSEWKDLKNKGLKTEGKMPPVIDKELCTKCGRCWEACPGDAFYGSQRKSAGVTILMSAGTKGCVHDCPVPGPLIADPHADDDKLQMRITVKRPLFPQVT